MNERMPLEIEVMGVVHHSDKTHEVIKYLEREIKQGRLTKSMTVGLEIDRQTLNAIKHGTPLTTHTLHTIGGRFDFFKPVQIFQFWRGVYQYLYAQDISIEPLVPGSSLDRDVQFARARILKAQTYEDIRRYIEIEKHLYNIGPREQAILKRIKRVQPAYVIVGEIHAPEIVKELQAQGIHARQKFRQKYMRAEQQQPEFRYRAQKYENLRQVYKARKVRSINRRKP